MDLQLCAERRPIRSAELFDQAQAGPGRRRQPQHVCCARRIPSMWSRASGCRVVDVDGVERIDFANNMAALIHGHAHPAIVAAVTGAARAGHRLHHGHRGGDRVRAAALWARSAGFEKMRFVNSGTEAVMAGVKAARAYTGRQRIAKVEGAYHGVLRLRRGQPGAEPEQLGDRRSARPRCRWQRARPRASCGMWWCCRSTTPPPRSRPGRASRRDRLRAGRPHAPPARAGPGGRRRFLVSALRDWTRGRRRAPGVRRGDHLPHRGRRHAGARTRVART